MKATWLPFVRCSAITRRGSRCSRAHCHGAQLCWQHARAVNPATDRVTPESFVPGVLVPMETYEKLKPYLRR